MTGPIALLRGSIDIFLRNPKLFLGIYLIPGILTLVSVLVTEFQTALGLTNTLYVLISAVLWIAIIVASIFMSIAIIRAVINPMVSVKQAYHDAKPVFWQYALLSVLVSLAMFVGFILLVIPGIIFFVWFAFSYFVLIEEHIGGIDAMKRSKALVSGKWWAVFGRLVALVFAGLLVGMISGFIFGMLLGDTAIGEIAVAVFSLVLNAVLAPISVAYLYLMYRELKTSPSPETPVADRSYENENAPASGSQVPPTIPQENY